MYITETQKAAARLHRINRTLLSLLWRQRTLAAHPAGAVLRLAPGGRAPVPAPPLPAFDGSDAMRAEVGG